MVTCGSGISFLTVHLTVYGILPGFNAAGYVPCQVKIDRERYGELHRLKQTLVHHTPSPTHSPSTSPPAPRRSAPRLDGAISSELQLCVASCRDRRGGGEWLRLQHPMHF